MGTLLRVRPPEATQNPLEISAEKKAALKQQQQQTEFQFLYQIDTSDALGKSTLVSEMKRLLQQEVLFVLKRMKNGALLEVFIDGKTPEEIVQSTHEKIQIWFEADPALYGQVFASADTSKGAENTRRVKYAEFGTL